MEKGRKGTYCVTAENRFTGAREIVTPPLSYKTACEVVSKHNRKMSDWIGMTDAPAYVNLKVVLYNPVDNEDYGVQGEV